MVYREPYEKSLASALHPDAIVVDPTNADQDRVVFRRYVGVGPPRYFDLFTARMRKDPSGNKIDWKPSDATPKLVSTIAYRENESNLLDKVKADLESVDLEGGSGET